MSQSDTTDHERNADDVRERRARWEAMEFTVVGPGQVRVVNESYEEAEEHTYDVDVRAGETTSCECPDDTYNEGPCKHRRAVEAHEPVLEAASAYEAKVRADGGQQGERCDDCEELPGEFPCAECAISGRRDIPE